MLRSILLNCVHRVASAAFAASLIAMSGSVLAQSAYPNRPIRLIAPFPPGGSSDVLCRLLAQKLTEGFGQTVEVENRPGASGAIGFEAAAKAPNDGYTIVIGSSSTLATNPHQRRNVQERRRGRHRARAVQGRRSSGRGSSDRADTDGICRHGARDPAHSIRPVAPARGNRCGALVGHP